MSDAASQHRTPLLGCLADDVTGATDLAINLVRGGMCAVQVFGVPDPEELRQLSADALVIAMKTRSVPAAEAVDTNLKSLASLQAVGIERFYFKYCSTFDSTPRGNIGPVAAALMGALNVSQTTFSPAFPRNGRTVYQGHLFVGQQLLNESGMEAHPLNPMTDANLVRVLGAQTDLGVGLLPAEDLEAKRIQPALAQLADRGCAMVVVDACHEEHLARLAQELAGHRLVTGGSGLAYHLPSAYRERGLRQHEPYAPAAPRVPGRSLILAGSCSAATQRQVAALKGRVPTWEINVNAIVSQSEIVLPKLLAWAQAQDASQPLLVFSTAATEQVSELQDRHGIARVAEAIEGFFAQVAHALVEQQQIRRLILAGGETAGAVVHKLGIRGLRIGPEICAGVPWTESLGSRRLALALKSGNFGGDDFFSQALEMLP